MTATPMVRISRISFQTDMTRADAPVIPFARVLETVWPDSIRWVGLIGRTRLTPLELDRINLETWPEFREPHALLTRLWDESWASDWGDSGLALQKVWGRSALIVDTEQLSGLLPDSVHNDPDATLTQASPILIARMMAERAHLMPLLIAPVVQLQPAVPVRPQPTASRTETDVLPLAA